MAGPLSQEAPALVSFSLKPNVTPNNCVPRPGGVFRGGSSGLSRSEGPPPASSYTPGPARLDARFNQTDIDQLSSQLSALRTSNSNEPLPPRPAFGKAGKAVVVRANHFPMLKFPARIFEYDVQVCQPF